MRRRRGRRRSFRGFARGGASLVAVAMCVGCAPQLVDDDYTRGTRSLPLLEGGFDGRIGLTFLGVGGWLIETPRTQVLTAPLFSNPSIWRTGLGTIRADSTAIVDGLRRFGVDDLSGVTAILSGHAHYDHLMDVPWIAARLSPRARVLVNTTGQRTLAPIADSLGLDRSRIVDVSSFAADVEGGGTWIRLGPDVRLLPLRSDHAPHFAGLTLYDGTRGSDLVRPPRSAEEWLEGETLAFLLEVADAGGGRPVRIYVQDAVAREPWGFVPPRYAPVDLAILVPATYAEVDWHPEAILENTRARHVALGHWENFFAPPSADPEPVAFTLLPDFIARLRRAVSGDDSRWTLPMPGTRLELGRLRNDSR
ncbi:hypothetical protein V3331_00845 [Gaopeijia maritima]|uniref:MBL fold metallo-hydrolase n=1 Tax=Gaopeijia maritima TaxID=3119007 RepID=UPI00324AC0F3